MNPIITKTCSIAAPTILIGCSWPQARRRRSVSTALLSLLLVAAAGGDRIVLGQTPASSAAGQPVSASAPSAASLAAAPADIVAPPQWEKDAGGKLTFSVASVKQNKNSALRQLPASNVPLDPGAAYSPTGGLFTATNIPLSSYIIFAYKLTLYQSESLQRQLPKWALSDRFDIQARADGNPNKDQFRLMLQSLLAERFSLTVHREKKDLRMYGLVEAKQGKLGPQLQSRPADSQCVTAPPAVPAGPVCSTCSLASAPEQSTAAAPIVACGGLTKVPSTVPGRVKVAGRDLSLQFIANALAGMARLNRPILDETGLTGHFDFSIEWTPEKLGPQAPEIQATLSDSGPTFLEALKEQLGLELKSNAGESFIVKLDHIDHLIEN